MDHYKEEHDDLPLPSGSNDDPSFPASATWSEARHSSSPAALAYPPLNATQRMRLGGTLGVIIGLMFGAALIAVVHHFYLFILRGRTVSSQFWIKNSSNALSTLVQWLCMGSVSVSPTQLIWWLLRRRPVTILQLDHLFRLSDPLRILRLASSRRVRNTIPVIIIATLLQAFAFISILAPNSLEVGSASPKNTTISVPTALFNKPINYNKPNDVDCTWNPSVDSQKVLGLALQSDTLMGWSAPAGCGIACNYTIQYTAPALRCTELAVDEANTMLPGRQAIGEMTMYNATFLDTVWRLTNPISIAWRTLDTNGKSTVAGTRCSLYNTTQQSVVSFVNNTGMIFPSIISYNSPVTTDPQVNLKTCPELRGSSNATSVSFYAYVVLWFWLIEQLQGAIVCTDGALAFRYPTADFSFNLASNNLFSLNETAGTFTPNIKNVSSALEQMLVNVTVALITYWGQTTIVDASVVEDQLVWVYHVQKLWIVYATALVVTAACGAVGFACILKNGEDRDLTFWDILRATRNSELDAVVNGERCGDAGKSTMLQYVVQGRVLDANTSGVFVLARPSRRGSN